LFFDRKKIEVYNQRLITRRNFSFTSPASDNAWSYVHQVVVDIRLAFLLGWLADSQAQ
jgi:hypothetical protein